MTRNYTGVPTSPALNSTHDAGTYMSDDVIDIILAMTGEDDTLKYVF